MPVNNPLQDQDPDKVSFDKERVIRSVGPNLLYEIPAEEIRVIGEFTTADGPFLEDWFLVIITKTDWYEIPIGVAGIDELLSDLSKRLGVILHVELANSTQWKTRIMYPESVKNKDLYKRIDVEPQTLYGIKRTFGLQKTKRKFSDVTLGIVTG